MQTVALHELDHVLGLDHSFVEEVIMYLLQTIRGNNGLNNDDILGMKTLYGK